MNMRRMMIASSMLGLTIDDMIEAIGDHEIVMDGDVYEAEQWVHDAYRKHLSDRLSMEITGLSRSISTMMGTLSGVAELLGRDDHECEDRSEDRAE